jgi:hypothetical protein
MSMKLPIELLATWVGEPASDTHEGFWPVPGTRYRLSIDKHKTDANAVRVQIVARADGSAGSNNWNWESLQLHNDSDYPLSFNWADIRLLDDSPAPKASWM